MNIEQQNSKGEWTLTALYSAMLKDLQQCHTQHEKLLCRTICEKEIRDTAQSLTRKLTPGEEAVLLSIAFRNIL